MRRWWLMAAAIALACVCGGAIAALSLRSCLEYLALVLTGLGLIGYLASISVRLVRFLFTRSPILSMEAVLLVPLSRRRLAESVSEATKPLLKLRASGDLPSRVIEHLVITRAVNWARLIWPSVLLSGTLVYSLVAGLYPGYGRAAAGYWIFTLLLMLFIFAWDSNGMLRADDAKTEVIAGAAKVMSLCAAPTGEVAARQVDIALIKLTREVHTYGRRWRASLGPGKLRKARITEQFKQVSRFIDDCHGLTHLGSPGRAQVTRKMAELIRAIQYDDYKNIFREGDAPNRRISIELRDLLPAIVVSFVLAFLVLPAVVLAVNKGIGAPAVITLGCMILAATPLLYASGVPVASLLRSLPAVEGMLDKLDGRYGTKAGQKEERVESNTDT
jgi:hypothetical protein